MPDMTNIQTTIQQVLVAARIADLRREAAALRAEREQDHIRAHAAAGTGSYDHLADRPSRRVRIGRRLVAFGVAIAGTPRPTGEVSRSLSAAAAATDDPCGDGNDRLARAT